MNNTLFFASASIAQAAAAGYSRRIGDDELGPAFRGTEGMAKVRGKGVDTATTMKLTLQLTRPKGPKFAVAPRFISGHRRHARWKPLMAKGYAAPKSMKIPVNWSVRSSDSRGWCVGSVDEGKRTPWSSRAPIACALSRKRTKRPRQNRSPGKNERCLLVPSSAAGVKALD